MNISEQLARTEDQATEITTLYNRSEQKSISHHAEP